MAKGELNGLGILSRGVEKAIDEINIIVINDRHFMIEFEPISVLLVPFLNYASGFECKNDSSPSSSRVSSCFKYSNASSGVSEK
jgi:hypothetical protein